MDTIYTTNRFLKSEKIDTPTQPEMAESSTYTTHRKLKDSTAASPELGDCQDVAAVSADETPHFTTKRKMKSGAER